jgi:hypothetical protein
MFSRDDLFGDCVDLQGPITRRSLLGDATDADRGELAQGWTTTTVKLDWVAGYTDPKGSPQVYLKKGTKIQVSDANPGGAAADMVTVKIPAGTEVFAWTGSTADGGKGYVSAGPTGEEENVYATRRSIFPPAAAPLALTPSGAAKLNAMVKAKPPASSSSSSGVLIGLAAAAAALAIKSKKGGRRRRKAR